MAGLLLIQSKMNRLPFSLIKPGSSLLAFVFAMCLTACGTIYDDEGECSVRYGIRFRYDYNMLYADAFSHSVHSVAVYGFDSQTGKFSWQRTDAGVHLGEEGYTLELGDIRPGTYDVIAWCGLENDGERPESFSVPQLAEGESSIEDLTCRLELKQGTDGTGISDTDLYPLFYGRMDGMEVFDPKDPQSPYGNVISTMTLRKVTNHFRVILQNLSGEDLDAQAYEFSIEEDNGLMDWAGNTVKDVPVVYREWNLQSGYAKFGFDDYPDAAASKGRVSDNRNLPYRAGGDISVIDAKIAVADLTIGRLMAESDAKLIIRKKPEEGSGEKGKLVASVPLAEYALLVKDNYGDKMDDQEYLDRQDEYAMTFFLSGGTWDKVRIVINSWRVVINHSIVE